MNAKRLLTAIAALLLCLSTGALAQEIYKWTDENGNVHYGDRPSGVANQEQLQLSSKRTDAESLSQRKQSFQDAEEARKQARADAEEQRRQAEEDRAEAEEQAQKCADQRSRLNKIKTTPRVYRVDENGERVYLDEAQRAQSVARAEEYIQENCGA